MNALYIRICFSPHGMAWIWLGELPTFPTSLNLSTNLSLNYLVLILSLDSHSTFTRLDSLAFLLSLYSIFFLFNLIGGFLACSLYLTSRYSCLSSLLPWLSLFNSYSFYKIFNKACSRHSTLLKSPPSTNRAPAQSTKYNAFHRKS